MLLKLLRGIGILVVFAAIFVILAIVMFMGVWAAAYMFDTMPHLTG